MRVSFLSDFDLRLLPNFPFLHSLIYVLKVSLGHAAVSDASFWGFLQEYMSFSLFIVHFANIISKVVSKCDLILHCFCVERKVATLN